MATFTRSQTIYSGYPDWDRVYDLLEEYGFADPAGILMDADQLLDSTHGKLSRVSRNGKHKATMGQWGSRYWLKIVASR